VAYLALFTALGGSAWAVAENSVGTPQLKNGAVTTPKIAKNAVATGRIDDRTIKPADLNPRTVASLKDRCPSFMNGVGDLVCVDKAARGPDGWSDAAKDCAHARLRLPTVGELFRVAQAQVLANNIPYWTDDVFEDSPSSERAMTAGWFVGFGLASPREEAYPISSDKYYVCAAIPGGG
jgi:hypothetical protein